METEPISLEDLKDALVQVCLDAWYSKAEPMTWEESIAKQWRLDDEEGASLEDGALITHSNPKGYLWVPFDDSVPDDHSLLRRPHALQDTIDNDLQAVNGLLDEEISEKGMLFFNNIEQPLSTFKTCEKIRMVAKWRILGPKDLELLPSLPEPEETEMWMLWISFDGQLGMQPFTAQPETLDIQGFHRCLEDVSKSLHHDDPQREEQRNHDATEAEKLKLECRSREAFQRYAVRYSEYDDWSYRFSDAVEGFPRVVEKEWTSLDSPTQYEKMLDALQEQDSELSPIFIRTCEIQEARDISRGENLRAL